MVLEEAAIDQKAGRWEEEEEEERSGEVAKRLVEADGRAADV